MNQQSDAPGIVRDYVRAVFRNRWKLIAYNLLVLLLAIAAILVWPREYRSEAKVWIKIGRENSKLDPTASTGKNIAIQENDREDEIKSVIDIIGSRGVVEQAVEQLGPKVVLGDEPLPGGNDDRQPNAVTESFKSAFGQVVKFVKQIDPISDHEDAVQEVLKHMEVSAARKSNVVSVQYDTDSPALAQAVVDAIIVQYKAEHSRIHNTSGARLFFGEQLETLETRVETTSDELRDAKDAIGLASISGHRKFLETQMMEVGSAKMKATQKLAEAQALGAELMRQLQQHPQQINASEKKIPNTGRDMIRTQLFDLQVERMELESLHKNHPKLRAIKTQEAEAHRELAAMTTKDRTETTQALNSVHQNLALELARVKSQIAGNQATLETLIDQELDVVDEIVVLNREEIGIKDLERKVELAVANYRVYAETLEDARVDEELNKSAISNVSIAQSPTYQEKPVSPSKLVIAVLTLAAMLFGSLVITAGMLALNDSLNSQQDVAEVVDAPVIISVPNQRQFRHVLR